MCNQRNFVLGNTLNEKSRSLIAKKFAINYVTLINMGISHGR